MLASFSSDSEKVPCGLWQLEHVILPSRKGMCPERQISARLFLWHWMHVSSSFTVLSCARGDTLRITVWQFVQATSRDSCVLPCQWSRSPLSWHDMQIALLSATERLVSSLRN